MRVKEAVCTELIHTQQPFIYVWPSGDREHFETAQTYTVKEGGRIAELMVAYGWRDGFEKNRRRVIVFLADKNWPAVEFVGTDAYDSDESLVWIVKKPGSNKRYAPAESPHSDFRGFRLVIHRDYVAKKNGFSGWALVLHEDQVDDILKAAWIRARHRGYL